VIAVEATLAIPWGIVLIVGGLVALVILWHRHIAPILIERRRWKHDPWRGLHRRRPR